MAEGIEPYRTLAKRAVEGAASGGAKLMTSELSIAECLYGAFKSGKRDHEDTYRQVFKAGGLMETFPISLTIIENAARIGAKQGMKLLDSVHVATAIACGCDAYLTNDKRLRSFGAVRVVQLSN